MSEKRGNYTLRVDVMLRSSNFPGVEIRMSEESQVELLTLKDVADLLVRVQAALVKDARRS
jgi:hypothetical protein